jgi:cysteine sulfinate desulfinase/cysteine desulfurase-like protein
MGVPAEVAAGAIRLTLGRHTTPEQIAAAARALSAAAAS